jgi:type I restriction enzyme R subunit
MNKADPQIRALEILYSRPHREHLTFFQHKEPATAIDRRPRRWTPERLDRSRVRGSGGRVLTDIVSLVPYTLHQDDELAPFREQVEERFSQWLAMQQRNGNAFTPEQIQWLTWMKENIASELGITPESFEYTPFAEHGEIGRA